jgi:hypothetical protein
MRIANFKDFFHHEEHEGKKFSKSKLQNSPNVIPALSVIHLNVPRPSEGEGRGEGAKLDSRFHVGDRDKPVGSSSGSKHLDPRFRGGDGDR